MAQGESMTNTKNIGYIGRGNIGKSVAEHLICEAFNADVFDVYQPAVDELEEKGAIGCASVAELAAKCEYIGICVRDDAKVDEFLYGDDGILANAVADTIITIHSTVSRAAVIHWADDARAKQCCLIDAAIIDAATGAKTGTLCYMVGGPVDIIERTRLLLGGGRSVRLPTGYYVEPAVFMDVTSDMTIAREAILGPVLAVIAYDDEEDAIRIANNSDCGLSGSVWSAKEWRALRIPKRLRIGTLNVNGGNFYAANTPFGSYKKSGIGREMGAQGFEEYLETKSIAVGVA
ncbi:MAG: hypothetical protein ACI9SK_000313 [Zhongshania sp.]|jgi:hypothetical protein